MISRYSDRERTQASDHGRGMSPSRPPDLTAAEVADLRALWCHAELVRHLLTAAIRQLDLAEVLPSLNRLLRLYASIEIVDVVIADLDAATALGADVPSGADEVTISAWNDALARGDLDLPAVGSDGLLLVAGVADGRASALLRVRPTATRVDADVTAALGVGTGEAVELAARIERERRHS